jgi:hypothetical protein
MIMQLTNFNHRDHGEYLNNKYPKDFFNFVLDIGSRGINHTWHIPKMAQSNPNTKFIGFEVDIPYCDEIKEMCKNMSLTNVKMTTEGFGKGEIPTPQGQTKCLDLIEIFERYNLDKNQTWHFKCDAEGSEHYLLNCDKSINILKYCTHIAFELHHPACKGYNFFITNRTTPSFKTKDYWFNWLYENFKETHELIQTAHPMCGGDSEGLSTIVLVKKEILQNQNLIIANLYKKSKPRHDQS